MILKVLPLFDVPRSFWPVLVIPVLAIAALPVNVIIAVVAFQLGIIEYVRC
jgi:hypothetical protein